MLTPLQFGLPAKFTSWRTGQLSAIDQILYSPSRFVAVCAPTGFGKSLVYMAASHMANKRTCILTSTKGLQNQLQAEFGGISADIRGQTNYRCPIAVSLGLPAYTVVADAPCKGGYPCNLKLSGGCEYYDRYRLAQRSPIVVTNYACWLYDNVRQDKLGACQPFDILILDEAHDASEQLADFLSVEIKRRDCISLNIDWPNPEKMEWEDWKAWGRKWSRVCDENATESNSLNFKVRAAWSKMGRKLSRVSMMKEKTGWVIEAKSGKGERGDKSGKSGHNPLTVHFDPLWIQPYAESALFRGVKKIVLVSASVRPKTAELLGVIPPPRLSLGVSSATPTIHTDLDFREYSSSFPISRRPIIHVPTVQMNYRNEANDWKLGRWLAQIDRIIESRRDRKGIIHAVSYRRARLIYENSRWKSMILIHGSEDTQSVVEKYKSASNPCVLISPSVSTGYDFPYGQCEYQIIVKIPFPPLQDAVVKARSSQDKDYSMYITMQTLVQSVGRGMRAADDQCETFIIDDNVEWFMPQNAARFAPKWFREAYTESQYPPAPPPKL